MKKRKYIKKVFLKFIIFINDKINIVLKYKKRKKEVFKMGVINYKNKNYKQAEKLLKRALNLNSLDAAYYLGLIHLDDSFEYFNYEKAKEYFYIGATKGHSSCQNNLGALYLNVYKDYKNAIKWFNLAALNGEVEAYSNLGQMYYKGIGVESDYIEAEKWLKKAATHGHNLAGKILETLYDENGKVIDVKSIKKVIYNGIEKNNGKSFYDLGILYANGLGVVRNLNTALECFEKAAELGYGYSYELIGTMYWIGFENIDRNYEKARYWYEKAANFGSGNAKLNLGVIYSKGLCVKTDYEKAVQFYISAANDGIKEAQFNVACSFQDGKGVEKNEKEAVHWFEKAAKLGDKDAKYELGLCYKEGKGVEKNLNKAKEYFIESLGNGCILSKKQLKEIRKFENKKKIFTPSSYKKYMIENEYEIDIPSEWYVDCVHIDKSKELKIIGKSYEYKIIDIQIWITFVEFPYSQNLELIEHMKKIGINNIEKINMNDTSMLKFDKENLLGKKKNIYITRGANSIYFIKISLDEDVIDEYRECLNNILLSFKILNKKPNNYYDELLVEKLANKAIKMLRVINDESYLV